MFALSTRRIVSASTTFVRGFKKTVEQLAKQNPTLLKGASVLVRVDFNVPMSKKDSKVISDDTRIREALPTINFLSNAGAKVILASHVGRPDGQVTEKFRLAPMAKRLGELINKPVLTVGDCIGPDVDAAVAKLNPGDVLMLENVRFHKEEETNDKEFAKNLSSCATIYVNDAFGTAHRAHASTQGVSAFMQHNVAGFLMEKEIKFLKSAVDAPNRPFAAIVGGAKLSTKIPVIESLMDKCDKIFIGGGMIFTFFRAQGYATGKSMVEEDMIPLCKTLLETAKAKGVRIILPSDVVIADEFKADANTKIVSVAVDGIPAGWMGLDIGPESIATFGKELADVNTVVWNGPMGVFEFEKFAAGTFAIAHQLADITARGGTTIIGGGDSVAAVSKAKLEHNMSHISTGGGASLEMLEGKELPGVACLDSA